MADPLGTAVRMPSAKKLEEVITAYFTMTSTGATKADTVTLDNDYPPIDLSLQSPVLGIFMIADETAITTVDPEVFIPNGQMSRAVAPDGAGEFQLTGARTFAVYHAGDLNGKGMITYVPRGSPQLT